MSLTYLRFPLQNRDLVYTRLSDLEFGLTRLLHPDDYPLFIENGGLSYEDGTLLCPPIGTVADVPMTDIDDDDDVEILKLVRRRPVPPIPAPASAAVFIAPAPAAVTFDPLLQETWARVATDGGGKKPSKYSRSDPIPSSILPSSGQPFGVFTPSTHRGTPFAPSIGSVTLSSVSDAISTPGYLSTPAVSSTHVLHPVTPAGPTSDTHTVSATHNLHTRMDDLVEEHRLGALRYKKTNKNIKLLARGLCENMNITCELKDELGSLKEDNQAIMEMLRRGFGTFEDRPDFEGSCQDREKNG